MTANSTAMVRQMRRAPVFWGIEPAQNIANGRDRAQKGIPRSPILWDELAENLAQQGKCGVRHSRNNVARSRPD